MGKHVARRKGRRLTPTPSPQPQHVRQTALVMLGDGVGNIVEQTPLAAAVCEMYQHVDIWCPRSSAVWSELLEGMPGVRRIYWDQGAHIHIKRDTGNAEYSALFATFLTTKFNHYVRRKGTFQCRHPRGTKRSERDVCMDAARQAGWKGETPEPYVAVGSWDKTELPRPYIVVSASCKQRPIWRWKRYQRYHEVVNAVRAARPDISFINLGCDYDGLINADGVYDLRDQTTLKEAAYIMQQAEAFVGNDCGLAHMAAALGTPTTVVFGPTVVKKNLPPEHARAVTHGELDCQPCQYSKRGIAKMPGGGLCNHECMSELPGAKVAAAVLEDLACRLS